MIQRVATAGTDLHLVTDGSVDPDGDGVSIDAWIYREAGSYDGEVGLTVTPEGLVTVSVPPGAGGRTIHVIVEVTDTGAPTLTSLRRAVIEVQGAP